ncbi:uncharacterized protein [Anabrus simplex]|uniref:uncharacterized protein n=1 Tax=Anabrus simplex TaxID=316456 RepID=UPI0035A2691B
MRTLHIASVLGFILLLVEAKVDEHHRQLSPDQYNVTDYVANLLDPNLQVRLRAALLAENFAKNPNLWLGEDGKAPCPPPLQVTACTPTKYRTADGSCNNVRHPEWGKRGAPFLRLLEPNYHDGVSSPRQSVVPQPLPSPQTVARSIQSSSSQSQAHEHVTSLVGIWGEMLLHDIASTLNPDTVQCCNRAHPECTPLLDQGVCRELMRSLPSITEDCHFDHREQMNLATAFLDGSDLYGNTDEATRALRSREGGRVKLEACTRCRSSSGLGALYSVLLREHNRIATALSTINKHWIDEKLFQEARRILIAQIQHITYKEFLPIVLEGVLLERSDLKLKQQGFYSSYSSSSHAGTINSVALSALQVFPLMIPRNLIFDSTNHSTGFNLQSYHQLIHSMLTIPAQVVNIHSSGRSHRGWDIPSLLIHLGRDHGLPSYPHWVQLCNYNLPASVNFSDISRLMSPGKAELLRKIYGSLENVDLLAGGILETPERGALVGPTFACLLAYQFTKLRNSDRFWYENDLPPSSFNQKQLQELRKVTLSGLLCDNTPNLEEVQMRAFVQEDTYLNVRISCELQPTLDLSAWQDEESTTRISDELIMQAIERAETDMLLRKQKEYQVWAKYGGVDPKSPAGTAASFSKANKQALALANTSILLEYASEELLNSLHSLGLRRKRRQVFDQNRDNIINFPSDNFGDDFNDGLQNVDISSFIPTPAITHECDSNDDKGPCDPRNPFRTITGHCNNLRNPTLGKSLTTFARLLPPAYENNVAHPRLTSVTGNPLPSPRLVSTMVHADISNLHNRYSLMLMQFAQFVDHDITFTPVHKGFFASIPDCRSCDSPRTVHPECMPIPVPRGDHYYPQVNHTTGERLCFPFMRSLPGQQSLGHRDQINQNSAFLDASQVYGEHACQARDLRSFGGRLNVTRHPVKGKDLLPQSPEHPECKAPSGYCFIAGDGRASEQPALTVIHTLFLREHNRLAEGLQTINPHWNDEQIYQNARRILTAAFQHITYNEFLPRILGWNAINLYELKLRPQGYFKGYNPSCNPSIVNEFAAAAFRIGHSLLRPHIPRLSPSYQLLDPPILLRDGFFNPDIIYQVNMIDEITRGLVSTPMENMDQFVTGEITNHLFEDRRIPHSGVDLIALNIQRGRDHGVRPYNDYRALCNLKRAANFEDLSREIPPEVIARLKRIYASVDDIDLFPGGMSERPLQGGLVGPTFACIIGIQFRQLRKCDRFWYENEDPAIRFTESQLAEIRKITLSKILCENLDLSSDMQRSAFDQPSNFLNTRVPCRSLPHIDLNAWRETVQGCHIGGRSIAVGETAFPSPCTSCICTSEGAQCASLRITDCAQLLREANRDAILRDEVCTAQCGFLLQTEDTSPSVSVRSSDPLDVVFTTTILPPLSIDSRPARGRNLPPIDLLPPPPRLQPNRPSRPANTFGPFKLSDLPPFIG